MASKKYDRPGLEVCNCPYYKAPAICMACEHKKKKEVKQGTK